MSRISSFKLIISTNNIYRLLISYIVFKLFFENISSTLCRSFEVIIVLALILYYLKSKPTLQETGKYINIVMVLLIIWSITIILRGKWNISTKQNIFNIIGARGVILYLLPFIFFLKFNISAIKKLINTFYYAALLSFPLWLLNWNQIIQAGSVVGYRSEQIGGYLQFFAAFLLFIIPVFNHRKTRFILAIYAIYLVLMLLNARRNIVFTFCLYGCLSYLLYIIYSIKNKKLGIVILTMLSLSVLILFVLSNLDNNQGFLSYFTQRFGEDSRSGVHAIYFYDFDHSPLSDFIIGRGMNGTYFFNAVEDMITGEVLYDRSVIETGYLDMILKGGLVYDILIMLVLIPAIFKGLRSRRFLGTACGLFLTTYLIDLYSTTPISVLTPRALLFWFCISICYRKERHLDLESLISDSTPAKSGQRVELGQDGAFSN